VGPTAGLDEPENLALTGFVPPTVQSTHGTIRRIIMDVEMQKANHIGDQITAVYSVNNANVCSCNNCCGDSRHKQVTTDLVMSSGTTKFLHTQYVSEKSDYKSWKVVKDLGRVVFKTLLVKSSGFLKRFVCGMSDRQHMTVKQLVALSTQLQHR
jgi:hypothetical protein